MRFLVIMILLSSLLPLTGRTATQLTVDKKIADLRAKADRLEALKNVLFYNRCSINYLNNSVGLSVNGMISYDGLITAMGPNFSGKTVNFEAEPLAGDFYPVVNSSFGNQSAAKQAVLLEVGWDPNLSNDDSYLKILQVLVLWPTQSSAEAAVVYASRRLSVRVPTAGESVSDKIAGPFGGDFTLSCN